MFHSTIFALDKRICVDTALFCHSGVSWTRFNYLIGAMNVINYMPNNLTSAASCMTVVLTYHIPRPAPLTA